MSVAVILNVVLNLDMMIQLYRARAERISLILGPGSTERIVIKI